ncbi:hypothetical protein [Serratia marcescens]|uniref:hypothetical protein n=1 Tax=Serratia TaxID=613 RepID=UPI00246857E4|nr:hypothetical protein [Serratia marcescens]WGL93519.1 hypothetical protein QFB85_11695 [Serratia marcescens]
MKWNEEGFNVMSLVVTFGDVIQLNVTGTRVGFLCLPIINSLKESSEITMKHHGFYLYCKAIF